jgi:phospholipid/cholesterol/gamma-HCH transport system ATP-binding protein
MYGLALEDRNQLLRRTGTAFQQDALFGSISLEDNVALPLRELTKLPAAVIDEMVRMRLSLVGLPGMAHRMPAEMSGGQRKRAALARASILDPELVFCDEPSAGLDPVIAAGIDQTLLRFRAALGVTLVVVTHELESIRTIADRAVMFAHGGIRAQGAIDELSDSDDPEVFGFFHRVAAEAPTTPGAAATPAS